MNRLKATDPLANRYREMTLTLTAYYQWVSLLRRNPGHGTQVHTRGPTAYHRLPMLPVVRVQGLGSKNRPARVYIYLRLNLELYFARRNEPQQEYVVGPQVF